MLQLIMLDQVFRRVMDVMRRFDGSDGCCRIVCRYRGRISRMYRRLGVNRGRDHGGRKERHRREIQLPSCPFGVPRTIVCHRFCHFIRA